MNMALCDKEEILTMVLIFLVYCVVFFSVLFVYIQYRVPNVAYISVLSIRFSKKYRLFQVESLAYT